MIKIIQDSTNNSKLLTSVLRHVKTTLNDRYIILHSPTDFSFLDDSKICLIKSVSNLKIYISNVLKNREIDFSEFNNYLKLVNFENHCENSGSLLIIEVENYKKVIDVFEKYNHNMNQENSEKISLNLKVVEPKFSLEKVILNNEEIEEIKSALSLIKDRELIYDAWGFSEIDSKPRLILNFYGVPGTGKTMSAHAVAKELNKKILLINYSEIESKYVGDAPKNLLKVFDVAKNEDALIFFDEADSFLGKRVENVSSSSDQSVNSLRSQMLILLENFEGVVVFATNLLKNYDSAFESRILKHLEFKLPSSENRIRILNQMLVSKIPYDSNFNREQVLDKLATISEGFSGREIKNAILESLTHAAHSSIKTISGDFFINCFEKVRKRKDSVDLTKNKISNELKATIENKIKNSEIFNKSISS